jgi:hypothetical protein
LPVKLKSISLQDSKSCVVGGLVPLDPFAQVNVNAVIFICVELKGVPSELQFQFAAAVGEARITEPTPAVVLNRITR